MHKLGIFLSNAERFFVIAFLFFITSKVFALDAEMSKLIFISFISLAIFVIILKQKIITPLRNSNRNWKQFYLIYWEYDKNKLKDNILPEVVRKLILFLGPIVFIILICIMYDDLVNIQTGYNQWLVLKMFLAVYLYSIISTQIKRLS